LVALGHKMYMTPVAPEALLSDTEWPIERPKLLDGQPLSAHLQWYPPPRRSYSRRELLADRAVNFTGASLSWVGAPMLCYISWHAGDVLLKQLGFLAHGCGLIAMLNCSAIYHYECWNWRISQLLLSLDHIGISSMIMGCYTPVMIHCDAYKTLALVWVLGTIGLVTEIWKLMQHKAQKTPQLSTEEWGILDRLNVVRYLVMGWAILPIAPSLHHTLHASAILTCIAGGLMYTMGVLFFISGRLEFHLAIWHMMVLIASGCFYCVNLVQLTGV